MMNDRERFLRTMRYAPVDHPPVHMVGPWPDTLARWHREGLPVDVTDVNAHLGVRPMKLLNVTALAGFYPMVPEKILRDEGDAVVKLDAYGRTVREFKDHTSMPEWIDFPVKTPDDLRRYLDEHFDISDLGPRFGAAWEARLARAQQTPDAVLLHDGGCYYWTIRSIAGVEYASYLLYDAADLVEEMFERYLTVTMEGLRRTVARGIKLDVIGFGEDIAYKTGPLVSPEMFRRMILPRYRQAMDFAHAHGVDLTWYDSDGNVRMFIPDYLSVGINGLAPCEVAASMDPVALRGQFGRDLRLIGGFDKRIVAHGPAAIDAEFARLRPVIEQGGYLPAIDHSVSADISWDNYRHYVDAVLRAVRVR